MITNLHDLFIYQIQELYESTQSFSELYGYFEEKCSEEDLQELLSEQVAEIHNQKQNLKSILTRHNELPRSKPCPAIEGLKKSGVDLLNLTEGATMTAVIIAAVQKVKHFEMALYGTAREYADVMGFESDSILLTDALEEKGIANEKLTKLAVGGWFKKGANKVSIQEA